MNKKVTSIQQWVRKHIKLILIGIWMVTWIAIAITNLTFDALNHGKVKKDAKVKKASSLPSTDKTAIVKLETVIAKLKTELSELQLDYQRSIYGNVQIDAPGLEATVFDSYVNRFSEIEKKLQVISKSINANPSGIKERIFSLEKNQNALFNQLKKLVETVENNKHLANYAANKAEGKI